MPKTTSRPMFEYVLVATTFAILMFYSYVRFFEIPYTGFEYNPSDGEIRDVFIKGDPTLTLQVNDRLLRVGSIRWEDYDQNKRLSLFSGLKPGDTIPLDVQRGNEQIKLLWTIPGPNIWEAFWRLIRLWWFPFVFWFTGLAALLHLWPHDTRWRLLIAFNCSTAIWLATGIVSSTHLFQSAIVMRMAIWLSLPVYWHLHWMFPRPIGRLPRPLMWGIYLLCGLLSIAEWFQVLPTFTFYIGFILAVLGSAALLVIHAITKPGERRDLALLGWAVGVMVFVALGVGIAGLFSSFPWFSGGLILGFPALPLAYFYSIYRYQLGGLEMRTNRLIALYLFFVVLGIPLIVLVTLVYAIFPPHDTPLLLGLFFPFLVAFVTAFGLAPFQRWVERRLLGMPLPPAHLVGIYADRIPTSLDMPSLVHLLKDEILPSLLVRQSALLRSDESRQTIVIYASGVGSDELPQDCVDPRWLTHIGLYHPVSSTGEADLPCAWVRLVLPLKLGDQQVGLWLLGRRDPDDYYAQSEIPILQTLANQTAIALNNILQTERLHALYQVNIESEETQKKRLALVLHDDVLGQMALLAMSVGENNASPQFEQAYQSANDHIREIISTLRPTMLNYGLRVVVNELADEILHLAGGKVAMRVNLLPSEVRYPPDVELHLYRIVQQACQNALKHAQASDICISGRLDPEVVELTVEDNGIGFAAGEHLDLVGLLANKHYGLAGMHERAALIGAKLQIESIPKSGLRVSVCWKS